MQNEASTHREARRNRGPRWTSRDLLFLKWIGEQYALRFDQAQAILGLYSPASTFIPGVLSASATRGKLNRYKGAGLLEYRKIFADQPGYMWLTKAGLRMTGLPFRWIEPSKLEYLYWVNQVRFWALQNYPDYLWRSERWLRQEFAQKAKDVHIPAAQIITPDGKVIGVEIRRQWISDMTLLENLKADMAIYDQIWHFLSKEAWSAENNAREKLEVEQAHSLFLYDLATI